MEFIYPTRNQARSILQALAIKNPNASLNEFTTNTIQLFIENGVNNSTFVFTNALTDIFPTANVNNENLIDSNLNLGINLRFSSTYFLSEFNSGLKAILNEYEMNNSEYLIVLSPDNGFGLDFSWFNNSNKFIHPLLIAYQNFKANKGMQFLKSDIHQIPIDYSVVLCYNHYRQKGFLSTKIVRLIIKELVEAANDCLNGCSIEEFNVEQMVIRDLKSPSTVKAAFDFIKSF
jgi:hypothetical protein